MTWHQYKEFDEDFYQDAPFRIVVKMPVNASPESAFATLENGALWPRWIAALRHVEWTSEVPLKKDATRVVTMKNGAKIDERFIVWDQNERMGFTVVRATIPKIESFGELYELMPTATGSEIRWTFVVKMENRALQLLLRSAWPLFYFSLRSVLRKFAEVAEAHAQS